MKPLNLLLLIVLILVLNDARSWKQSRETAQTRTSATTVVHSGRGVAPPELFARARAH